MRGADSKQEGMFSYVSPEARVPAMHPLRPIRAMISEALAHMHGWAVREALLPDGQTFHRAGAAHSGTAAAGALFDSQRAAADRAARVQPSVPMVRRAVGG